VDAIAKGRSVRIRSIAAAIAGAAALAIVALVLLAFAYNGAIANPPDDSDGSQVGFDTPPNTGPKPTLLPPTDGEVAAMHTHASFIDDCMAEAGFPEYVDVNVYDPDFVPSEPWNADLSPERAAAAAVALWGDTGSGADYAWQDAGCAGYATHMIGADDAN
jgi:hypothetical protein